ncbi:MAG TPA: phage tail assembly protein [Planctomycetota bacterium]|jgi:hypothetical protein|nr:phage tail assembly protein [Planctomycetota bacterium]
MREFELHDGYTDRSGEVHRSGRLRPATAGDELRALRDFRVHIWPERYLDLVLCRSVARLGTLERIDPGVIGGLSDRDRAQLEALYREVNGYCDS